MFINIEKEYLLTFKGILINSPIKVKKYEDGLFVVDVNTIRKFNRDLQLELTALVFNKYGIAVDYYTRDELYKTYLEII